MKTVLLYPETYVMIIYNQLVNCYYLYESGSGSHRLEILALLHQNMYTLWGPKNSTLVLFTAVSTNVNQFYNFWPTSDTLVVSGLCAQ